MRDWLTSEGIAKHLIHIVPHGVDLKQYQPASTPEERRALRQSLGIDPNNEVLLFVGIFDKRKGLDYLIHAWEMIATRHSSVELYLIAPRREETEEAKVFSRTMDDQLQASPYTSRVHLLGKQTNVNEFMRAADILSFPAGRKVCRM